MYTTTDPNNFVPLSVRCSITADKPHIVSAIWAEHLVLLKILQKHLSFTLIYSSMTSLQLSF